MIRTMQHLVLIATVLLPANAWAQISGMMAGEPRKQTAVDDLYEDQLFEFTIHPQATAEPALKYPLYPSQGMLDRDASNYYHRAIHQMDVVRSTIRRQNSAQENQIPELNSNYEAWLESAIDQMPVADMKAWLDRHDGVFENLQRANISSRCDWGILPDSSEDIVAYHVGMSEIQNMRSLGRLLAVAIRVAIVERDYETVIKHLRSGYKIAHDTSECKSVVATLVGIACARIMQEQHKILLQQPDAPNLYWSLIDMPAQLTDARGAIRNELSWLSGPNCIMKTLREPEITNVSRQEWQQAMNEDFLNVLAANGGSEAVLGTGTLAALSIRGYPIAKRALIESGYDAERVKAMPVLQVIAIHQKRYNERNHQKFLKTLNLPYQEMAERFENLGQQLELRFVNPALNGGMNGEKDLQNVGLIPFMEMMIPAVPQVLAAEVYLTRDFAALQTLEAIRAHVADTGKLPTTLAEISVVPVPKNPATGELFEYQLNNDVAALKNYGYEKYSWKHYQIRLAK